MKTFTNLRRDLRTLYKPKNKSKRPDDSQELDGDITETPCDDSSVQLASVPATTGLITAEPHTEPPEGVAAHAQAATSNHDQGFAGTSRTSQDSGFQEVADDSVPAVEEAREGEVSPVAESETGDQESDLEEAEPLTFEEAQWFRDQKYTRFGTEEPEDFTDGPARFIASADGVKHCVALLVPYDLSQRIQAALRGQRKYFRLEYEGMIHRQSLSRLQDDVHTEIASCNTRLFILDEEGRMETEDGKRLEQQLMNLRLMLSDIEGRKEKVTFDVEEQAERLREVQRAVNAHLEDAFVCARLIPQPEEEPDLEVQNLDVSQEYLQFCQKLERAGDNIFEDVVLPLDSNSDHLKVPPPGEEDQARQAIINSLWAAKEALDLAHRGFDNRENDRAREYEANVQAADRGEDTTDESPEAFDVRWVVRFRNLTRALIEAEAVYSDVKRKAIEAGVSLPFADNESVFEGVGDDTGYSMSKEQELVSSAPSPTVRKWLSNMPEGGETGSVGEETQLEADEWDAEEVGISDSVSLVAEGRQRSRIDRWQDACLAEKSQ
jgi:hypothetical protein